MLYAGDEEQGLVQPLLGERKGKGEVMKCDWDGVEIFGDKYESFCCLRFHTSCFQIFLNFVRDGNIKGYFEARDKYLAVLKET